MLTSCSSSQSTSFNTQPPEGGWVEGGNRRHDGSCFNTQPPEGGWTSRPLCAAILFMFQHAAARRRLVHFGKDVVDAWYVSTRSRPKAAGKTFNHKRKPKNVSTRSRPKAAGLIFVKPLNSSQCFNTQPPEGGWLMLPLWRLSLNCFNTQPPEGGWS